MSSVVMEFGVPLFPLLHLPNNALMNVLRTMSHVDRICLSLCSKKATALVKSLDYKARFLRLTFNHQIVFELCFFNDQLIRLNFLRDEDKDQALVPGFIHNILYQGWLPDSYIWKKSGFGLKNWIVHFLEIFNLSKVHELRFERGFDFVDLKAIRKVFNELNVKELSITHLTVDQASKIVFETIPPTKQFVLSLNPHQDRDLIQKVLTQNYDNIVLGAPYQETVNDLLAINSQNITSYISVLTEKDLNRFLKHWINGSNPRLKSLFINFSIDSDQKTSLDEQIVLRSIQHTVIPTEIRRHYIVLDRYSDEPHTFEINGGIDIQRMDGTNATIEFVTTNDRYWIGMWIWN